MDKLKYIIFLTLGFAFNSSIHYIPEDFSTIQEGINESSPYDTIYVTEGVYFESISISIPLTLLGNEGVVINGSGFNSVINIEANSVIIDSFEIIGDSLTVSGIIVKPGSEEIVLKNNIIHGMHLPNQSSQLPASYGILSYGDSNGPPNPPKNLIIENNEIYDINAFAISLGSFSDSVMIRNNEIHDIDRIDLSPYGYEEELSVGVIAQFGSWIKVENNSFSNVLLASNLLFSYGEVSNNSYDDSTKIFLAYNDTNPINTSEEFPLPPHASAVRLGEFAGVQANINAHLSSIQDAIDYADSLTTINITSGTYFEKINFEGKDVQLIGENPANTILIGNENEIVVSYSNGETSESLISGFTITGGGIGISCSNGSSPNLENLLIYGNMDSLFSLIFLDSDATIKNVTISDNWGDIWIENSSLSILNSIINQEISIGDFGVIYASYSNIYEGFEGEGNINLDPLFCNPEYNDYTLDENSPCIGTGLNGANMGVFSIGCNNLYIGDNIFPNKNQLNRAFPNPFNPTTSIDYSIGNADQVYISIYDILGNEIKVLINEYQIPGNYNIMWNAENHPSGIYFVALKSGFYNKTKKLLYIK